MIIISKVLDGYTGKKEMVPGSQTMTSSGSFVVPYDGEYTLTLYPSSAGTNRGGYGTDAYCEVADYYNGMAYGGNGGGGSGSCFYTKTPLIVKQTLTEGESVQVTVTTKMISFGSYASIATGSKPSVGGDASSSRGGIGSPSGTVNTATYTGTLV